MQPEEPVSFESLAAPHVTALARVAALLTGGRASSPVLPGIGRVPSDARLLPKKKAELVAFLSAVVSSEAGARAIYDALSDLEKAAVQEAIQDPSGRFDSDGFHSKYGRLPDMDHRRSGYGTDRDTPPKLGLLIVAGNAVPPEVKTALAAFVPKPRGAEPVLLDVLPETHRWAPGEDDLPLVVHMTQDAALRDVEAVLRLSEAGRLKAGESGRISEAGARAIRDVLAAGDFYPPDADAVRKLERWDAHIGPCGIRPFAWVQILQAGKLARATAGRLALTREGRAALSLPPRQVLGDLWEAWLATDQLHELNRVDVVKGQKAASRPLRDAFGARETLAEALTQVPVGRWITVAEFSRFHRALGFTVEVVRDAWALYIEDAQYGAFGYDGSEGLLEGRFVRAFLLEYAATLGVIDVALVPPWDGCGGYDRQWGADSLSALSRYDGLVALRVTPLGAWMLGSAEAGADAPASDRWTLRVLPNRDVCATGPAPSAGDVLFLERIAEKTGDRVWRLSEPLLLAAIEAGLRLDAVREFLGSRCADPLPDLVDAFLTGIAGRATAVRDAGAARILECRDEFLAVEIASHAGLKKLCTHGGGNRLIVPFEKEGAFRTALRRAGWVLPAREGAAGG